MFEARRPAGWLFLLLLALVASAQTLTTTTISDTVYRADGTPAGGTLLISWPEFTTAAQGAVAAGNTSVTLGAGGALSVGLVPNANATPANTVYTVVYQLDDGTVKTEYWVVRYDVTDNDIGGANHAGRREFGFANGDRAICKHCAGRQSRRRGRGASRRHRGNCGHEAVHCVARTAHAGEPNRCCQQSIRGQCDAERGERRYIITCGRHDDRATHAQRRPSRTRPSCDKELHGLGTGTEEKFTAGLVPTGELGTGTANNSLCLHGDSSWGGCGSSSNAISIQNVPVATTTPTNNQVMTYVASAGEYEPEAGGGVTAGMQAVKYATDFNWTQSPASNLGTVGPQTINLAVCATGVTGTEPWYYVYISGTGTAEAVLVTGGTCTGNGQAGTLQFTTLNTHPAGYTITSASGGLQEALIAARFIASNPSGPSQSGKVIVPLGACRCTHGFLVRASNVTVDFSGSIIDCNMLDTCIFAGDGLTLKFYLSQTPFTKTNTTLFDEEYLISPLEPRALECDRSVKRGLGERRRTSDCGWHWSRRDHSGAVCRAGRTWGSTNH